MNHKIIFLIGISLFVLVLIGLGVMIYISPIIPHEYELVTPIIVITGFFIFLIAAILVGSSLLKMLSNK
jgi:hypothetical protein